MKDDRFEVIIIILFGTLTMRYINFDVDENT